MSQEEIITVVVSGLVFVLVAWCVWYLFRLTLTPPAKFLADDADFEEFYCDLCASSLTVDFTREEAEGLYRTWQGQSNSVETQYERRNNQ